MRRMRILPLLILLLARTKGFTNVRYILFQNTPSSIDGRRTRAIKTFVGTRPTGLLSVKPEEKNPKPPQTSLTNTITRGGGVSLSSTEDLAETIADAASIGGFPDNVSCEEDECDITAQNESDGVEMKKMMTEILNEKDVLSGDFSAAFSMPESSLPFSLPKLTGIQRQRLANGERIQEQGKMGREGKGYVCFDVLASASAVWDVLLDFDSYPKTIPTVREMTMFTNTNLDKSFLAETPITREDVLAGKVAYLKHGIPSVTRASFVLSKFRLVIAAIHKYRPHSDGDFMIFTLDPACTNLVLKSAKGVWHTQSNPDGRQGVTRVWLLCEVKISRALPKFIVEYAARKAMPRATQWLKPTVEAASQLWLRERDIQ